MSAPASMFVKDTIVRNCGAAGIYVNVSGGNALVSVEQSRFTVNGYGVVGDDNAYITIRDSVAEGNADTGFWARTLTATVPNRMLIDTSIAAQNFADGFHAGGTGTATMWVSNSSSFGNSTYGIG